MSRITINPRQCGGRPCVRGMRVRVADVLDLLASGLTSEQILHELPDLEPEDIEACVRYGSRAADSGNYTEEREARFEGVTLDDILAEVRPDPQNRT